MKLIIAIVQNQDSRRLSDEFVENGIRATKLSSTGGFLRAGNTTFLIGVQDRKVDSVLELIKENCSTRSQTMMSPPSYDFTLETDLTYPVDVEVGGATLFVLPIDQFLQF
ncbi:cyclic-di-AMP receptor [Alkalibacterium sp. MB6]|uniref:cyclic-di-AMP receptor n=1 Tax=Alkalibacterium sp. MB6 TaxID=2081965 RepID=UPI00137AC74E|nr:cyclic-di-AMP receptor [Alkalibacterium sp. MB6]